MGFLLFLSDLMVPLIIFYIVGFGILAKRQVFDDFLRGAKEGMGVLGGVRQQLWVVDEQKKNVFFL